MEGLTGRKGGQKEVCVAPGALRSPETQQAREHVPPRLKWGFHFNQTLKQCTSNCPSWVLVRCSVEAMVFTPLPVNFTKTFFKGANIE